MAAHELTDRDVEVLGYVCRHGLCTPEQIARAKRPDGTAWFTSQWAAYRRLRALADLGLVTRQRTWWHGPHVVMATKTGSRLARVDLPLAKLDYPTLGHAVAVVDLSEMLVAEHQGSAWLTERELRRDALRQLRAEGLAVDRVARPRTADGMLLWEGRRIAIELDLTAKRTQTYGTIFSAYAGGSGVDAVWWFAPSARLRERIARTAVDSGMQTMIEVHDFWPLPTELPANFVERS